jgi:RecB family endonuclease NucS
MYMRQTRINHAEQELEEQLVAHLSASPDVVELQRQYRFADRTRADIVYKCLLPGLPDVMVCAVEVKAHYAGRRALAQLMGYVGHLRDEFAGERVIVAGVLAAPTFSPLVREVAAACASEELPFALWRVV